MVSPGAAMKRRHDAEDRICSSRSMLQPIPIDLKLTRLGAKFLMKPHHKKLLFDVESRICLGGGEERDHSEEDEKDRSASKLKISSYPDMVAYRSIAVTLGQAGHIKELFHVIDTMRSPPKKKFKPTTVAKWDPRLEPDFVVCNAVLNACVQRKQWEGDFWVLQQLKQ